MKLYQWQEQALSMSRQRNNLAFFATMGTGKTCATIQIMREKYKENGRILRTLILGPVAVIYNWKNEILKFSKIDKSDILVSSGTGATRVCHLQDHLTTKRDSIVVTNYESLRNKDLFQVLNNWAPEVLICDESHMVKSVNSLQSKMVYELSVTAKLKYILTGTPILNTPMDIFMQYKILDGGATFGTNFFVFRNKFFRDANEFWRSKPRYFPKWEPRRELFDELSTRIFESAIRVKKEDCLDLPERVEKIYHVELSKAQKKAYEEMSRDFLTFVEESKERPQAVVANLAMTKALKLQQIITGFVITEEGKTVDLGESPRLDAVEELLTQLVPEHKVILWSCFSHHYLQLAKLCDKLDIKYVLITGEQDAKEKQASVDAFEKDSTVRVVIANRRAGGTGINLIQASYSIVYGRNFSLAEELQSQDRNHRAGSEIHDRIVKIDLCARGTIDEKIIQALQGKEDVSARIIDFVKESLID